MLRRRALVIGLASFMTACAGPRTGAPVAVTPGATTQPPTAPTGTPGTPATAAPTAPPATPTAALAGAGATSALPTAAPTATPGVGPGTSSTGAATPTPQPTPAGDLSLDVRLWNGDAEVQLDGRTIQPGHVVVPAGDKHQLAALVDGDVVALMDVPPTGGAVNLVVPPPLASLAIMIENQADARPQTGLTQADVVYEALAEGGITRFIALFLSGDAAVVGPVRSLRHYFAFMAADYGADVVHIGASPEGFAWRDAMNMGYLDESAGDPGVYRIRTRPPPHNAYTETAADRGFLAQRGRQNNHQWGPLLFSEQAPTGDAVAESVTLGFFPWAYRVAYTWDAARARYLRFMEGSAHLDAASGEQIAPASVVVQFADVEAIPNDDKLRLDVNLVGGSGQLAVFSSGTRRAGTWSKSDPRTSTVWLDEAGHPLVIPPGPVWVEVVPLDSPLASA